MLRGKVILPERNGAGRGPTKAASILPGRTSPGALGNLPQRTENYLTTRARQPSRVPVRQERDHQRRIV
jgi:hypothetical protein